MGIKTNHEDFRLQSLRKFITPVGVISVLLSKSIFSFVPMREVH